jgi:hypothetical protein
MNDVYRTKFHGDEHKMITKTADVTSDMMVTNFAGIRSDDPEFARRNVATSRAAKAFGLTVIPETHFSTHTPEEPDPFVGKPVPQLGTAMEVADGVSPLQSTRRLVADYEMTAQFNRKHAGDIQEHEAGGNVITTVSSKRYRPGKIDMHHPTTQRQLLQLQALDFVTQAGMDRHGSNYIVAPSKRGPSETSGGEVKGIDNDGSWGGGPLSAHPLQRTISGYSIGNKGVGLPPRLHKKDAQKFKGMTRKTLRSHLGHTVTDYELDWAMDRLNRLKAHINVLEADDKLLDDQGFGPQLYEHLESEHKQSVRKEHNDRSAGPTGGQSYIARDGIGIRDAAASRVNLKMRKYLARKRLAADNASRAERGLAPKHEPGRRFHQTVLAAMKNNRREE